MDDKGDHNWPLFPQEAAKLNQTRQQNGSQSNRTNQPEIKIKQNKLGATALSAPNQALSGSDGDKKVPNIQKIHPKKSQAPEAQKSTTTNQIGRNDPPALEDPYLKFLDLLKTSTWSSDPKTESLKEYWICKAIYNNNSSFGTMAVDCGVRDDERDGQELMLNESCLCTFFTKKTSSEAPSLNQEGERRQESVISPEKCYHIKIIDFGACSFRDIVREVKLDLKPIADNWISSYFSLGSINALFVKFGKGKARNY